MGKDYAQLYIEGMHRAGYLDVGDEIKERFASFFNECLDDVDIKKITGRTGFDHELFCAAVAQVKTSRFIGCSNDGPYNIAEFWDLSKEQTDLILDILPAPLSGFAKGAVDNFWKHHQP